MRAIDVDEVELAGSQQSKDHLRTTDKLGYTIGSTGSGDVVIEVALEVTQQHAIHRNGERIDAGKAACRVGQDVVEPPTGGLPFEASDLQPANIRLTLQMSEIPLPRLGLRRHPVECEAIPRGRERRAVSKEIVHFASKQQPSPLLHTALDEPSHC